MAKGKTQKLNVMRTAANMRAEYRKWLTLLIVGLVVCIAAIGIYYVLVSSYILENQPGVTWILAAIAAILLGWFGNKFSKTHRAYEAYISQRKITTEDVKEFLRTNSRDNPGA